MFDFMGMMGNYESRKVDRWDDDLRMLSTASVTDGEKPYETAIAHPDYNDGKIIIIGYYDTKEDAQAGHDKWLNLILSDKLPTTLVDCANAETAKLCESIGGAMAYERKLKA